MEQITIAVVGERKTVLRNLAESLERLDARVLICAPPRDSGEPNFSEPERLDIPFERALQRPDVDAIAIASRAEAAGNLAEQALAVNKDALICGLPSTSNQRLLKLYEIAREHKRILTIGLGIEGHPVFANLRKLIAENQLGGVRYLYVDLFNPEPFGSLETETAEMIAVILRLLDEVPSEITVMPGIVGGPLMTLLSFSEGRRAHVFTARDAENRLVVSCANKSAVVRFTARNAELAIYDQGSERMSKTLLFPKTDSLIIPIPLDDSLTPLCVGFLDSIRERQGPSESRLPMGLVSTIAAAQKSREQNGRPITPEIA